MMTGLDVVWVYRGQRFHWNAGKASANRTKHGISFESACEVFFDPLARYFDAGVPEEYRLALLGRTVLGKALFVVNIEEENDFVRIISARPAESADLENYEELG